MAQIRGTIELLARILCENGTSKIRAETFRLAKFNNDQACGTLWKLLFELLYYCDYLKIDEVCIHATGELSTEECVVYVKRQLKKRGFLSCEFLALPMDMSSGSRELLLAFGWLMCKENIISKFMQTCTSPLDDDTAKLGLGESTGSSSLSVQLNQAKDPTERVQQLLWLNNKLRLSLRSLHALQRERAKLKHKIRQATLGASAQPDMNHLSMLEVYMLRHPELLKKNLQLLESDNERLQNLLKWKDHEDIFWQWMNSVLDAKLDSSSTTQSSDMGSTSGQSTEVPPEALDRLEESRSQLSEAIIKYEGIVDELEQLWESKSSDISEKELDEVLASIDMEIAIQKANINLTQQENVLHNQLVSEPRMILQRESPKRNTASGGDAPRRGVPIQRGLPAAAATNTIRDICSEIEDLQTVVNSLESELIRRQELFQDELQHATDRLSDVILIPPITSHQ